MGTEGGILDKIFKKKKLFRIGLSPGESHVECQ